MEWQLLVSGLGMMIVAACAVALYRARTHIRWQWLWIGAAMWAVAVVLKTVAQITLANAALAWLEANFGHAAYVITGAMLVGVQSSAFEIGLALVAGLIWRQLGKEAVRAVGIGVGAGAFEAIIIALAATGAYAVALSSLPESEAVRSELAKSLEVTPLLWLAGPVERALAIPGHMATRSLVFLGLAWKKPWWIVGAFAIFTVIDSIAGGLYTSGMLGKVSLWWAELAFVPGAIVSLIIVWRLLRRGSRLGQDVGQDGVGHE